MSQEISFCRDSHPHYVPINLWLKLWSTVLTKAKGDLPASTGRNIRFWPLVRLMIYLEMSTETDKNQSP